MAADEPPPEPDRLADAPHPRETLRLFGQQAAEGALLAALAAGRMHHAWMLRGPEGIGKATLAYRLARRLIADGAGPVDSLDRPGSCPVAARFQAQSEPRLAVLRRAVNDKTGKLRTRITVDEVRRVKRFLEHSAPDGGWRVVLVDAADEMNPNAANALLKFLEEPPARTVLLLVAHAASALLPTIRSRCRVLDLAPLGPEDLAAALAQAGHPVPEGEAAALSELAGGSAGRAIRLMGGGGLAHYAELVALIAGGRVDRPRLVALADLAAGRERETVFPLLCDLALVMIGRMARAGVSGPPSCAAAADEPRAMTRLAASPEQARLWAEAAARLAATARHARAVNLDPGQTIIDMFLDLDDTLTAAARLS
ncbi:DNA polymerase III subunit delta' [Paralimibaculum aggregatum]|uniref:DNA polymerase III subunit delta n=1 Tax=Paralimibaculum aggregatum TaxID=3036245 RepID=A0ABQ6LLT8_9RHOB|nr:DNA polymerase III subunit delta' [Limibaculum sp. NKW23]GMG81788.1 DNA polymerase III subunit delta' [Limibaculum sp. NKW23]